MALGRSAARTRKLASPKVVILYIYHLHLFGWWGKQVRKEVLVLAKSCKTNGYCVAGVEIRRNDEGSRLVSSNWIRPVTIATDGLHQGSLRKAQCEGFGVFDVVEMELTSARPVVGQPENWLLNDRRVRKVATLSRLDAVQTLVCATNSIWSDPVTARDDQVSSQFAAECEPQRSLMIVQPEDLSLTLELSQGMQGVRRRVYASFFHSGNRYTRIVVTDPTINKVFCNQFPPVPGVQYEKRLRNADGYWLTLSLSPEFKGNHYVLVAGGDCQQSCRVL